MTFTTGFATEGSNAFIERHSKTGVSVQKIEDYSVKKNAVLTNKNETMSSEVDINRTYTLSF